MVIMEDKIKQNFERRQFTKLRALHDMENNRLLQMKYEYSRLPEGEILIPYKNAHATYYIYDVGIQKSVKRSEPVVDKLMRKRVLKRAITIQEAWCRSLEDAEKGFRRRLKSMEKSGAGKTLIRILELPESDMFVMEPREYEWKSENHHRNSYRPELFINGNRYYPDFMILLPDGSILIWEHFGMMDDIDYASRAWRKIENYRRAGYVQHTNLICTYESDIENGKVIDEIIRRFIL